MATEEITATIIKFTIIKKKIKHTENMVKTGANVVSFKNF